MTDSQILHIFVEISLGRGRHGSFLSRFAEAVVAADPSNFQLLRPLAKHLIETNQLEKYLDSFSEVKA